MEPGYRVLPAVYDQFVADRTSKWAFSYDVLLRYLDERRAALGIGPRVLSLGAGTCVLEIELSRRGLSLTCLDLSADMLEVARGRAAAAGLPEGASIDMVQGDMRHFTLGPFDLVLANYYALNYLTSHEDLAACFASVRRSLAAGGAFVFDAMHNDRFADRAGTTMQRFTESEGLTSLHEARYDADGTVRSRLTWFHKEGERYVKLCEEHRQRVYLTTDLVRLLREAGFTEVECYKYATLEAPQPTDKRVMFLSR